SEATFQLLKQKLCSAPILALPEGSENFVVYYDASHKGLGVVLMQREKVIAYASSQLKVHEKNYTMLGFKDFKMFLRVNTAQKSRKQRKQRKDIEVSQSNASTEPMTEKETNEEVLALETAKTTQALEIASLKSRVKQLEKKASKRTHKLKRLYRGRSIEDIDKDAKVSLVDETQGRSDDTEMFDSDALIGDEVFAKNDMTEKEHDVIPKEVSAAETLNTAGIKIPVSTVAPSTIAVSPHVITEVEITLAQTLAKLKSEKSKVMIQEPVQSTITIAPSTILKAKGITFRDAGETTTRTPTSVSSSSIKDKGKAKMVEPEVPLNKKDQIRLDEELARRLDAEEQEATRLERENVELQEQATLAKIKEWDNVQAMIDADYELCKRLQEHEQVKSRRKEKKVTNKSYEEIQKAFDKTMGWINNFKPMDSEEVKSSEKKAEGIRKKSIGKKRAGNEQKQESSKRQIVNDDKETDEHEEAEKDDEAEMKKHMEIVQDKEEIAIDAIPLATKPPMIVEYKIVKVGQKGFYHLIRADGSSKRMDNPNITMEEYIRLEEEKAQKHGKVFNWETAKYGKIWYDEDIHDLRSVETEFPAIAFNDGVSSKTLSCEPMVSIQRILGNGYGESTSCTVLDDDVVVLENSETKEEDVKEDESDHNKERYTFEDDDDDGEFDDLD
ncbi:ribonuclease H-like domain-containing protein, partial [Tanacetum coccineum]